MADTLADGTPIFAPVGELPYDRDEDLVQCHLCGQWFKFLGGTHLSRTHGWSLEEYRDAFHLDRATSTCSRGLSQHRRQQTRQRIAEGGLPHGNAELTPEDRAKRRVPRWRSLALRHPTLLAELHPARNESVDPHTIAAGSKRQLWWRCPAGHEWQARVVDRASGTGCPACANAQRGKALGSRNRRVAPGRSLAVRHPELVLQLHKTRNPRVDPRFLGSGSGQKLWWTCERGHDWQASVTNRTSGTGCPVCAAERRSETLRRRIPPVPAERSLAVRHPRLAAELHPTRNLEANLETIAAGSARIVWWRCPRGHEWQARVNDRSRGSGCPVCAKARPPGRGRSLSSLHPELVAELHLTRNGQLDPDTVYAGSNRKLWWRCGRGHEWPATVAARARGSGCPVCARELVAPDRSLALRHPDLVAELHPTRNGQLSARTLAASSNRKVWWRCPRGHEWQAVVSSRSRGSGCPHCYRARHTSSARNARQVQAEIPSKPTRSD